MYASPQRQRIYLKTKTTRQKPKQTVEVYIMVGRNYKVYPKIADASKTTRSFRAILSTGAGSIFINLRELPMQVRDHIKPFDGAVTTIRNTSGKKDPIVGTITLVVQLGTSTST